MNCQWCMEYMDESAVVCPSCRRERKDFHQHKVLSYVFGSLFFALVLFAVSSGKWLSPVDGLFTLKRVFTSLVGWSALIFLCVTAFCYFKASKIAKSWWWH